MSDQPQPTADLVDMHDIGSEFSDLVHIPPSQAKNNVIIKVISNISDEVVLLRSSYARQMAHPSAGQYLMQAESQLGARVFGAIRQDKARSFFCLNSKTWLFYQADRIGSKISNEQSIRYEITIQAVLKIIKGKPNQPLNGKELDNFYNAIKAYSLLVKQEIYKLTS